MSVELREIVPGAKQIYWRYFFTSIPIVRAIRLTDPACRPSSAAIFEAPTPCRASVIKRRTSCSAHCFGFGIFMMRRSIRTS